ncbi:MAG: serine hydrolase domain-containing protein [Acidobacteriota bacterium]
MPPSVSLRVAATAAIALATTIGVTRAQGTRIDIAAVDRVVEAFRQKNRVPGMAVVITRNRDVVHVAGYGTDSRGAAITGKTRLPIASLSKSFTALAVMQLVEAGRVNLDASVRDYLRDFSVADPRGATITVRQLLTHTSGLADTTFPEKSGPLPGSLRDGVALLRTATLTGDPGSKAHYHNPNYWVAARIVEVVSGMSFLDYLQRHIFAPLGMVSSTTTGSLREVPDLAIGHVRFFGIPIALREPAWFLDGASGVVTTPEDLARWLIMQNNAGETADGMRIVSAASLQAMHEGLGWSMHGEGASLRVEHTGWLFTFTAHQILLPSRGYGIAVISNTGLGLAPADSEVVAETLVAMINGETPDPGYPVALIVDLCLLALLVLSAVLGVRAVARARPWAIRHAHRSGWRNALALTPRLIPIAVLAALPATLSFIFGGRDASSLQMLYVTPSLIACLVVASVSGAAATAARAVHLRRAR